MRHTPFLSAKDRSVDSQPRVPSRTPRSNHWASTVRAHRKLNHMCPLSPSGCQSILVTQPRVTFLSPGYIPSLPLWPPTPLQGSLMAQGTGNACQVVLPRAGVSPLALRFSALAAPAISCLPLCVPRFLPSAPLAAPPPSRVSSSALTWYLIITLLMTHIVFYLVFMDISISSSFASFSLSSCGARGLNISLPLIAECNALCVTKFPLNVSK